ncbi:MAG: transposon-transfer assisting family protein [Lachnospiraceae bacterium]|nr:transposon-transfer assisting family protein [Lachnospiraceae bacterium]
MNREQEQQLVDYYSATDKYIKSALHSQAHQSVFTKENDKFQWLVLEQKSKSEVEVRQTDSHGTITARDNYELTRNIPKCVGVERLHKDVNMQIPFNADEINLIYQFGEQSKAETCANLSAILPQIKDSDTRQIVNSTLKKLNALSEKSCAELTATTKRRKIAERDHSIRARLAKAKEQTKQPTVAERKKHRTNTKGKGDMEL